MHKSEISFSLEVVCFTLFDVKEIPFCPWSWSNPDLDITADRRLDGDDSVKADGI